MKANVTTKYSQPIEQFKIENIPVVRPRIEMGKYKFKEMKVGQSFYFEPVDVNDLAKVRSASAQYGKRHHMKFSVVRDGEGYRCGRIE